MEEGLRLVRDFAMLTDATQMLGPGVYVLWQGRRVVKIAWAKSVLARVATHRRLCNEVVPSWMPIKGIRFDRVAFHPCTEYEAGRAVIDRLKMELNYDCAEAA